MPDTVECIVIGAGVIGLAVARALALQGREVLVLEAEGAFGMGTSSRNSEVIHAGIYYPADSLKARLCVRGKALLYDYCASHGVAHEKTGKLIVATNEAQAGTLEDYRARGETNGVLDLEVISRDHLKALEPEVEGVAALWSPSTGILDAHGFMFALLGDLEGAGGVLALKSPVERIEASGDGHLIHVGGDNAVKVGARFVVNAAGHDAPHLGEGDGAPQGHFAAGHYFTYAGRAPFSHLIYPVAEEGGLGVHATLDLGGQIKFGPDVSWRECLDYSFDESRKGDLVRRIQRYFPGLEPEKLQPGFVGIRPKIAGQGEDKDFVIAGPDVHGKSGLIHLYGIESPGLTSALALAEEVVAQLS